VLHRSDTPGFTSSCSNHLTSVAFEDDWSSTSLTFNVSRVQPASVQQASMEKINSPCPPTELRHCFDRLCMLSIKAIKVSLVNSNPWFFHTVFETGRTEALVCLPVVRDLSAVFEPDGLHITVLVVAPTPYPGAKVARQHINFSGSMKRDE